MLYLLPAHTRATRERSPTMRPMLVPHIVELFEGGFMVVGGMIVGGMIVQLVYKVQYRPSVTWVMQASEGRPCKVTWSQLTKS